MVTFRVEKIQAIRQKLNRRESSFGSWLQIPHTSIAEILGQSGYDWIAVDLEHGSIATHQLPDLFRALELGGTLPLARLAQNNPKDCKQALEDSGGDIEKATQALREKGVASATKRVGRDTNEGVIETYLHTGGRVGAMVELGCETDFVARTEEFQKLAHDIAMQVAAMGPVYVDKDEIEEGDARPPAQISLMQQPFIKNSSSSVGEMVTELAGKVGENIRVVRFTRLAVGE